MKITKTIKVPATPATTKQVEVNICDYCDKESTRRCNNCLKDVCKDHYDFDWTEQGDYPAKWCTFCHPLLMSIKAKYERLVEELWQKEEKEVEQVKKDSQANETKKE